MQPSLNVDDKPMIISSDLTNDEKSNFIIAQDDQITIKTNNEYHQQGLKQANIGFYFGLGGGVLGFLIIIASIIVALFSKIEQALVVGIAGVIMDVVSAIFYKITSDTSKSRTAYFDKLRDDTRRRDSLMLCNTIEDSKIKDNLKVKLALYFAGVNEDKICEKAIETCITKISETKNVVNN